MRKKILIIQQPPGGGSIIALYDMIRNLSSEEYEFEIIFYHKNEWSEKFSSIANCKMHYPFENKDFVMPKQLSSSIKIINWMLIEYHVLKYYFSIDKYEKNIFIEWMHKIKPDIVHHNNGIWENIASVRAATLLKIPQVLHTRGFLSGSKSIARYLICWFYLRKMKCRIYFSAVTKSITEKKYFLPAKSGFILNDFIGAQFLKNDFKTDKKDCNNNGFIISNIGRITRWKGQHVLIDAIHLIRDEIPDAKVFFIGSCEKGIGCPDYYAYLQNKVKEYELGHMVFFLGERTDIRTQMIQSDLIVHTAIKAEPQGLVIIEGLLCKKPVIATNMGGAAELIKKYGAVGVEPGDALKLASLILQQYQSRNKANQSFPLYQKLKEDFDPALQRTKMLSIYNIILPSQLDCN